jgi:hypothetical protein
MATSPFAQFTSLMDDMQGFSLRTYAYLFGSGYQRYWMIPTGYSGGWVFNPTNIAGLHDPFTRGEANTALSNEYSGSGDNQVNLTMGYGLQIGYMGMMERAFRDRHRTVTRAQMLVSGRKAAHGDASGVHKGAVEGHITELLNLS